MEDLLLKSEKNSTVNSKKNTSCFHCGDKCIETICFEDKYFCCNGCKSVYQILNNANSLKYYQINQKSGIKKEEKSKSFDYLDNTEIANSLLNFDDGGTKKVCLYIPEIHCSSCVWLLERLNKFDDGIINSEVNFTEKEINISFKKKTSLKNIFTLINSFNYSPTPNKKNDSVKKNYTKKQILQIGIAGFCFGNIMLLSFPEYTSYGKEEIIQEFKNLFGYLNFGLSIPVVVFSAKDYFKSFILSIKNKKINIDVPISIGIITLFLKSSYEVFFMTGSGYFDSLSGLVFFLLIGRWYQSITYKSLSFSKNIKSYFPLAVKKKFKGQDKSEYVDINKIKKGDDIEIRNNEIIPVDSELISEKTYVDYSFITGEETAIEKKKGDSIYGGAILKGGAVVLNTLKSLNNSYISKLWSEDSYSKRSKSKIENTLNRISVYFTFTIISISIFSLLFWFFYDNSKAIHSFTSVLVIACPCALALSLPFTLGTISRFVGKKGVFLKDASSIEKIKKIDTIVFDKTGTLTVQDEANVVFIGKKLSIEQKKYIFSLTFNSLHPLSQIINKHLGFSEKYNIKDFIEIKGYGIKGFIDGVNIKIGSLNFVAKNYVKKQNRLSEVYVSFNGEILGHYEISTKIRPDLEKVLNRIRKKFEIHLLSGDNSYSSKYFSKFFDSDKMHFNKKPISKLEYIKYLQKKDKNVLMIGDGLNDYGAMKQSNLSFSVSDNIFSFSPSCDGIVDGKKFYAFYNSIMFVKNSFNIFYFSVIISFLYNIVGIYYAIMGMLDPVIAGVLMPLSSVSVVLFISATVSIYYKLYK